MTNTALLREKIDESGYKIRFVAKKIGITYQGFLKKINNESEFKASEIQGLKELLNLTDEEISGFVQSASRTGYRGQSLCGYSERIAAGQ